QIADLAWYEGEGLRYFANVVAKFSKPVRNAISRLGGLDMAVIAPSHGPVWRSDPARIVELYDRWCGYADGPAEPEVTLLYGSMYGFTERMMGAVAEGVSEVGVPVDVFDAGRRHPSYILPSLWSRNGVLVGAPTYEGELFPPVSHALRLAAMKRPRNRLLGIFGSYGWSGGADTDVGQIVEGLDWELVEELHFAGKPTGKQLEEGRRFGRTFGEAVTRG
ncbi:MAG: FprA family A-type flavoprotein, partial [Gemmatimonadales bacterium]|nr:FprA family A-type flavoprotein [Gemmatimonadales bacterium]